MRVCVWRGGAEGRFEGQIYSFARLRISVSTGGIGVLRFAQIKEVMQDRPPHIFLYYDIDLS